MSLQNRIGATHTRDVFEAAKSFFVAVGILPFLLAIAFLILGFIEPRFWSPENIYNVFRQSSYLTVIAMGQLLVLLTGNFDLSVGSNIALVAVVANVVAGDIISRSPDAVTFSILAGAGAGMAAGTIVGCINGIGVAYMRVHSFIMTLGTMSVALGVALMLSGGMPVTGMPPQFGEIVGYGRLFGMPVPVLATLLLFLLLYVMLSWTRFGRHIYSIGSNIQASRLSGINTQSHLFWAHTCCGAVVAFGALLLVGRVGSGEAHMGSQFALSSITACVLGGVSLLGGNGKIVNVVLGAFFLTMLTNGMTMTRIGNYAQIIADGTLLIIAVWAEQGRLSIAIRLKAK